MSLKRYNSLNSCRKCPGKPFVTLEGLNPCIMSVPAALDLFDKQVYID